MDANALKCRLAPSVLQSLQRTNLRIYITGSSGWFGRCLLELLHTALGQAEFDSRVCPFTSRGQDVRLRDGRAVRTQRFDTLAQARDDDSVFLNFAYLTKEQTGKMALGDYLDANRAITQTVFNALDSLGCRALFMPSSGAVYRPDVAAAELTANNAYGKLKLEDEQRALDWAASATSSAHKRAIICRVFNVSGPYINKYSDYALSSIIDASLRSDPIRIRTPKTTLRSFVAIEELLSLVLGMLLSPTQPTVTFDTAGEDVLEINALIAAVSARIPNQSTLERPALIDDIDRYLGDRETYAALLAEHHIAATSLARQIDQTAAYIRQFPGL